MFLHLLILSFSAQKKHPIHYCVIAKFYKKYKGLCTKGIYKCVAKLKAVLEIAKTEIMANYVQVQLGYTSHFTFNV